MDTQKKKLVCIDEFYVLNKKNKHHNSQYNIPCSDTKTVHAKLIPVFRTERVNTQDKHIIHPLPTVESEFIDDHDVNAYLNQMDKKEREHYEFAKQYFGTQFEIKNSIGYTEFYGKRVE